MRSVKTHMNAVKNNASAAAIEFTHSFRPFKTEEQRRCTQDLGFFTYWNRDDEICAAVLEIGRDPAKFELIRALFPVVRTAVSFDFPLSENGSPFWWTFCFYAGWQFGKSCGGPSESILRTLDRAEVEHLLCVINQVNGERLPTPETFCKAFNFIWSLKPPNLETTEIQRLILAALVNAFAAGIAAALWT